MLGRWTNIQFLEIFVISEEMKEYWYYYALVIDYTKTFSSQKNEDLTKLEEGKDGIVLISKNKSNKNCHYDEILIIGGIIC